jgi:hypothetical protein
MGSVNTKYISCEIIKNDRGNIIKYKPSNKLTTKYTISCINNGMIKIQKFLKSKNLLIRKINRDDYIYYSDNNIDILDKKAEELCGEMTDLVTMLMSSLDDLKEGDDYGKTLENSGTQLRLTFVIVSRDDRTRPLGLISGLINYYHKATFDAIPENTFIKDKNSLYIEIACTSKDPKNINLVGGSGFALNAYVLLFALKYRPDIQLMWGKAVGSVKKNNIVSAGNLYAEHIKRKCIFPLTNIGTEYYVCDIYSYLNELFRKIDSGEYMHYIKTV